MSSVREVAVSDIRPNPVALRSVDTESEDFIQLRDSIADIGLLSPISVRERTETVENETVTYYEIIDGLHRYTGASAAGLEVIPVNVMEMDETEAFLAQVMGNALKIETKPVEYTKHLQRILSANTTLKLNELALKVHKSASWLNQRFGLLKLNEQVQALVDEDKITVLNGVILSKLPREEQLNYIEQAMTMTNTEFGPLVTARIKQIKEAEAAGQAPGEAGYVAAAVLRKKTEIEGEVTNLGSISSLISECKSREDVARATLNWVLQLDGPTVATKEAQFNEKRQRTKEEQARRKAERADKRAKEAAEAAAKAKDEAAAVATA